MWEEIAKLPTPQLAAMPTPLVEGLIVFDKKFLECEMLDPSITIKEYAAQVDLFKFRADAFTAAADSFSPRTAAWVAQELLKQASQVMTIHDPIPEPDPTWTDEMKEAHRALHSGLPRIVKFRRYG